MRLYLSIFVLLFTFQSFAQNISGQAFYESKTTVDMNEVSMGRDIPEDMKKMIAERMKSALEKTFILTFNKDESLYKEEEKLDANPTMGGMRVMMGSFFPGVQYKNLQSGELLEEREFFGKEFLIVDEIQELEWEMTGESKQIGEYTVLKATAIKKVDPNDMQMARPRKDSGENKDEKTDDDDPMNMIEIPEEIEITAWFTPQIPISNGPGEYGGLPGLIMELSFYRTTILCSKIVLSTKQADKISRPKKGEKVSREQYVKIVAEKMEEMQENFRGSGGRRRGGF